MPIRKVYRRFRHLDPVLSDPDLAAADDPYHRACAEMWRAIKEVCAGCDAAE